MSKRKSKQDNRIDAYCQQIADGYRECIVVKWHKSRTWGHCPSVVYGNGEKVASVSGWGYDKLSSVLGLVLRPLSEAAYQSMGCGVPTLIRKVAEEGAYVLTHEVDGPGFDVFRIEAVAPAEGE